jgi:hypothetical protein
MNGHRLGSIVLLAGGVALLFAGLASALGFSVGGMIASAAAIAALLYAGGAWFGAAAQSDHGVILFTHTLTVASGPMAGRAVWDVFGNAVRPGIEEGCRKALAGQASRFNCGALRFAASPVRSSEGAIVYGLLLSGAAAEAEATATPAA